MHAWLLLPGVGRCRACARIRPVGVDEHKAGARGAQSPVEGGAWYGSGGRGVRALAEAESLAQIYGAKVADPALPGARWKSWTGQARWAGPAGPVGCMLAEERSEEADKC